jgi:hypothetical protein
MYDNADIVKRAEAIAERDGGVWHNHLETAQMESRQPPLDKVVRKSDPEIEGLRKAAGTAALMRLPGTGNPDRKFEIGECEAAAGRVRVTISHDSLSIHGVNTPMLDIDADLRGVIVQAAANFAAAETVVEQAGQRATIARLIDSVLFRNQFLDAQVRQAKARERYGN